MTKLRSHKKASVLEQRQDRNRESDVRKRSYMVLLDQVWVLLRAVASLKCLDPLLDL